MISVLHTLHTWGRILAAAGGILGVVVAVPAFRLGGVWKTCLRIAAFVLILGLSMLLEEQVLSSAGVSHLVKRPSLVGAED
jgi:ABC-type branched-subunit amino acid transport system permease subunit